MTTVGEIYDFLDEIAPFGAQQSYDNSGICVGDRSAEVGKVLTALDITCEVAEEAAQKCCQLLISHHPVIFRARKTLSPRDPAVMLAVSGIAAISAHTSFDSAAGGMNDLLAEALGLRILDTLTYEEGKPMGYVCEAAFECSSARLAADCKKRLGCRVVRYTEGGSIKRVAICSGSGGSLLDAARQKGCQALVTGDVKHSDFIEAHNAGFCLVDAGHFYTENIFHRSLARRLGERFPQLVIEQTQTGVDPVDVYS